MRKDIQVGNKIKFKKLKHRFNVVGVSDNFLICTRPINMIKRLRGKKYEHKKTYLYTIVDFKCNVRGRDNLVFGFAYITKDGEWVAYDHPEGIEQALLDLENGEMRVSHRNELELDIESITTPSRKGKFIKTNQ